MSFKDAEIPFVKIGNRRGLTHEQIMNYPWISDFVQRFRTCFENSINPDVLLLIEDDEDSSI